jgi:hypothetical protein
VTTALQRRNAAAREIRQRFGIHPGRKTAVQVVNRRKSADMPPWRARFVIPDRVAFAVSPGPVAGMVGCSVNKIGTYLLGEVEGRNRAWVEQQADTFATRLGHTERPLCARIVRDPDTGPPSSGPFQRGDDHVVEIGHGTVVNGQALPKRAIRQCDYLATYNKKFSKAPVGVPFSPSSGRSMACRR